MPDKNKKMSPTKMVIPCRISFANIWEARSINGSEEKYSVSCLISKSETKLLEKINAAVEAAKEVGKENFRFAMAMTTVRMTKTTPDAFSSTPVTRKHRRSSTAKFSRSSILWSADPETTAT